MQLYLSVTLSESPQEPLFSVPLITTSIPALTSLFITAPDMTFLMRVGFFVSFFLLDYKLLAHRNHIYHSGPEYLLPALKALDTCCW